ncbi:MAG TPA: hypothetical protein DEG17_06550 [Cyanobacteria bacterium UBA11149]|nr:hypothetical protein [Cyanobacteria bacterium UBA11367]HBE57939.1 hypothetical protein [Cyanobacteria bacterium UBA11366]HBK66057.1 hypothetical protein [Cyanobacteria bacterium UBA11166]HBR74446.1 hypothetical protein [Cyanobacteria bacterium UBA11159]HBS68982.1 hypothetical protein [Cyanobacteria bacterium UBA11153]HBW88535.1 hypothetical protein [Cyanobacteria bacterium UBA11149]HCA93372.1 hypothetical protein [Cyanobacteria bacterium UBA9226]
MKIKTQFLAKFAPIAAGVGVATFAIAITSAILPQSATAQSADRVKPLEDLNNRQNEQDPLTGNSGFSVFDLIHSVNQSVDSEGFADGINRNLDRATDDLLRQREQLLKNRQEVSPTNPPSNSQTTN